MAETPKPVGAVLSDTLADVYTCPAATTAVVQMIQVANVSTSVAVDGTVVWSDDSNSDTEYTLLPGVEIKPKAGQSAISGPLYLDAGDKIRAKGSVASQLHVTLSVVEVA